MFVVYILTALKGKLTDCAHFLCFIFCRLMPATVRVVNCLVCQSLPRHLNQIQISEGHVIHLKSACSRYMLTLMSLKSICHWITPFKTLQMRLKYQQNTVVFLLGIITVYSADSAGSVYQGGL